MSPIVVIIPCYNEEHRLDVGQLPLLLDNPQLGILLVDDGSRDGTLALIRRLAQEHAGRVEALALPENRGKGEAVRAGLLQALSQGAQIVGYLDADFATPPGEFDSLLAALADSRYQVALGSRVRLLGRHIERRPLRHYLGRVFATLGSLALRLSVYDTQCGAKAFRRHPALARALASPFASRWAFDLELLQRLLTDPVDPLGPGDITEVPLQYWHDARGSKLGLPGMVRAVWDVAAIARQGKRRSR